MVPLHEREVLSDESQYVGASTWHMARRGRAQIRGSLHVGLAPESGIDDEHVEAGIEGLLCFVLCASE